MTMLSPEGLRNWHIAEIASPITQDRGVQETKHKFFPNDIHGQTAYQMYLELQNMHDVVPEMAEIAYMQVTACVLGAWIDTQRGWIPKKFPIKREDVNLFYYIFYKNVFNTENNLVTFPDRRRRSQDTLGIDTRLPIHLIFDNIITVQDEALRGDPDARNTYMAGYNLAIQRWRDLTTQA